VGRRYHPNRDAKMAIFMKRFGGGALIDRVVPGMSIR
jgi:hypothetical protein